MNLRHAAALAFVGWYLMIPPYHGSVSDHDIVIDRSAPLSKWEILDSFDSANDCADQRMRHQKRTAKYSDSTLSTPETVHQVTLARILSATCIATDDPRLKEK
jgi:hypothetical protein